MNPQHASLLCGALPCSPQTWVGGTCISVLSVLSELSKRKETTASAGRAGRGEARMCARSAHASAAHSHGPGSVGARGSAVAVSHSCQQPSPATCISVLSELSQRKRTTASAGDAGHGGARVRAQRARVRCARARAGQRGYKPVAARALQCQAACISTHSRSVDRASPPACPWTRGDSRHTLV